MRSIALAATLFLICVASQAQTRRNPSGAFGELLIGRHTFIDVGPPNDFYEVIAVRAESDGSSVERITFTPSTDSCLHPATIEIAKGTLNESIPQLLQGVNPCEISARKLTQERKRRKRVLVFSGAEVSLEARCDGKSRLLRTDILDQDWFDSHPQTPEYTSWTMKLLNRLDAATGPGVLDRPIFPDFAAQRRSSLAMEGELLNDAKEGKLDNLFSDTPDRISELYRQAQTPAAIPSAKLVSSTKAPTVWIEPTYPPIAKAARVEGSVVLDLIADSQGKATHISFESGPPMLRGAIEDAAKRWKFPIDPESKPIKLAVHFSLNCPTPEQK